MKKALYLNSVLILVFASNFALAQQLTMPNVKERPETTANKIEEEPEIDGLVIDDAVWQNIVPITKLIQTRPQSGEDVSEKTEVRIAYTSETFYLSVVCYESNPGSLVVSDMRRDGSLENIDAFLFILDTYHDNQNGFMFGTNSQGIEYDAQVDNEGQGNFNQNRQQGGVVGGFNLNWDAAWTVKTSVGDYGWSAEFAIPFKTLRFQAGQDQTWGLNFQRNITKTNEVAFWAPLPIEFDLKRLSLEGTLSGLDLVNPGNLKVIPYVLGRAVTDGVVEPHDTKLEGEFGADVKYSITPNVTLDLTYNTDFAQVEVDEQQVNLNRFNLFFPEKRPFFLENAGLFSVGSPGEVDMFFSRKIGIAKDNLNQAVQVPIIGGARVSGRINQTNVGFLNMFTDDREIGSTEVNNYTVARVNHQVASRSTIGAAIINKTDVKSTDDYNRVFALDGKIGLGKKAQITSYIAKSSTPGIENQDYSYRLQAQYEWNGLRLNADLNEVAPEFNPEVGFLGRDPFRKYEFMVFKRVRSENWQKMLEVRPHITYRGYWDSNNAIFTQGFHQTGFLHVDNHWVWKNGLEIHTGVNFTKEGLSADFTLDSTEFQKVVIPADTYDHAEAQIVFMTNTSKNIYFSTRSVIGGYFGGQRQMHNGTMGFRLGDSFNSELKAGISYFNLPFGDVFTEIYGWRLSYSLTPRINIQSLIQYNSKYDLWSSNVRFSILQAANSGLFVVFNQLNLAGQMYNRSLTLKYTYLFDVIK